ncbi:RAMP superfamily CRISPR-associated protein [Methylicorpusculum oleiharenae]|uniref:RAMP superfamily CRISPR-associated protein n=1 Tax=Methylicorpusculum oleiharenae TaxID=1338687 RepID=UPI00135BF463|nr:RAMP superfamily CRISPR-associated protein [Methylicorpusculum oleiharenae]MCD2452427.1 RAMP superfamily CRISPR-associated protein [Methylicorpusculum oleiharenae]
MTHFLNHYTLKYTPLSPLHIGADESYEPGNYIIDDEAGALYSFDSQAALSGLSSSDGKQLLTIVNGKPDDAMLTKVQSFFHNHREKLLAFAKPPVPTASGVKALYEKRIGKTAQHEGQGKRVINKLEIDRTSYNPVDGCPLLPGSSIKGAIRTALLDQNNDGKDRKERNQQIQQRLFADGKFHTDPMRLVSIGDASWQGNPEKPACQVQFAVNRKRKLVTKDGIVVKSQAEASNLYQLLECVAPHHYQSFTGSLTLHNTQSVPQDDRKLPKQHLHWTVKEIAKACNIFYMGLFWQELQAMKERNYLETEWQNQIEHLLGNGLLKRLNEGDAFLLRIGRHSGAEALTLNGVRKIKIMQGRGERPKEESQPKTWWLAADDISNKQGLLPFGWVLVEIDPKSPDSPLQHWLENSNNDLTAWMQQQLTKQNGLKDKAELRQREEEGKIQAEQKQAEELLLKQQAEQQRLDSLSPIEQEIETFLKPIQVQEHDTRLLQELEKGRWQNDDAKRVAEKVKALMELAGKWMPDFAGDNKQKVKLKERSLKVLKYLQD